MTHFTITNYNHKFVAIKLLFIGLNAFSSLSCFKLVIPLISPENDVDIVLHTRSVIHLKKEDIEFLIDFLGSPPSRAVLLTLINLGVEFEVSF